MTRGCQPSTSPASLQPVWSSRARRIQVSPDLSTHPTDHNQEASGRLAQYEPPGRRVRIAGRERAEKSRPPLAAVRLLGVGRPKRRLLLSPKRSSILSVAEDGSPLEEARVHQGGYKWRRSQSSNVAHLEERAATHSMTKSRLLE